MNTLNSDQQKAVDGLYTFLLSNNKEYILSGAGGTGKSYLISYVLNDILPKYENICKLMNIPHEYTSVAITATTNKAAEVLSNTTGLPTQTIHSYLGLNIQDDYKTGTTKLVRKKNSLIKNNEIIFIDECSMIDSALYEFINKLTFNCKIIYVGDHNQLPPVYEKSSPVYINKNLPFFELKQPMRNAKNQALMDLCNQIRDTVETTIFKPIQIVPGSIDWLDNDKTKEALHTYFIDKQTNSRILNYSNKEVNLINDYIRFEHGYSEQIEEGEHLVSNTYYENKTNSLLVEDSIYVTKANASQEITLPDGSSIEAQYLQVNLVRGGFVNGYVPVSKRHYQDLIKYYSKLKDWNSYFFLKNNFMDLRPFDACTIHKAQGSTYHTVFINLTDLSQCKNPDIAAKLLYVACTRATDKIYLFGELANRFGGLIK